MFPRRSKKIKVDVPCLKSYPEMQRSTFNKRPLKSKAGKRIFVDRNKTSIQSYFPTDINQKQFASIHRPASSYPRQSVKKVWRDSTSLNSNNPMNQQTLSCKSARSHHNLIASCIHGESVRHLIS